MHLHSGTAAPTAIGNGGGITKAAMAQNCHNPSEVARTEYATLAVAIRFRLTISTAREICRMAGLAVLS